MGGSGIPLSDLRLVELFGEIEPSSAVPPDELVYSVVPIPGASRYFLGKDPESLACLLVVTNDDHDVSHPPIRLANLDAQFGVRCYVRSKGQTATREDTFTVVRCREPSARFIRYFLSVCESLVRILGQRPTRSQLAKAISRLAAMFRKLQLPPRRAVTGLFGELYLLLRSSDATRAIEAWRPHEQARFDFALGDVRIDVKTTAGRVRRHTFAYEQCNPPLHTLSVVASLFAEETAAGVSLHSMVKALEGRVTHRPDLVFKLHETVAATLGSSLKDRLSRHFDLRIADSSLRFFSLKEIPAIRTALPAGVSDLHFQSDLSGLKPIPVEDLKARNPEIASLVPARG